jgi:hypothetical protein
MRPPPRRTAPTLAVLTLAALAAVAPTAAAQDRRIGITPDEIRWTQLPRLGSGIILFGDPAKRIPYVIRLNVPPNIEVPPHTHPTDEHVTVISGAIGFGEGPVFDKTKGRLLPAGSYYHLPARTRHFAWTGPEGAVIQAHGVGPFP